MCSPHELSLSLSPIFFCFSNPHFFFQGRARTNGRSPPKFSRPSCADIGNEMVNVRSAKAAITYTVKVKLDRHNYRKVAQEGRSLPCGQGGIRVSHTHDFRICSFPFFCFPLFAN